MLKTQPRLQLQSSLCLLSINQLINVIAPYLQGGPKNRGTLLMSMSSPIIDRFSKILLLAHSADNLQ